MKGIIAVHDGNGETFGKVVEAATLAETGLLVEPAWAVDYHEVPELIVYVAESGFDDESSRFRNVVAQATAQRAGLIVLIVPPETTRSEQGRWVEAGAWHVLPFEAESPEIASYFAAALRVARGARATPSEMLATLLESEERNRAIFEAAVDGIVTIDEQGIIDRCNAAAARLFGYTIPELIGKSVNVLMPEPYRGSHDRYMQNYRETGKKKIIGIGREATGLRKDGSQFPVYLAVSEVRLRDRRMFTGIIRDLSERKASEARMARLAMAVDQAAESIVITDASPMIQYVNPAFERDTGYTAAEAVGQNPRILKSGQHGPDFYERLWRRLGSGTAWSGHLINRRKDGTLIDCRQVISPIVDADGRITNYVSVWRDVTREMQLEEQVRQSQKMESIGRLAGGIAHDFNNLLTAIMGLGSVARERIEPGHPAASYLDDMMRAAKRSSRLTRQLLTFSRKHLV